MLVVPIQSGCRCGDRTQSGCRCGDRTYRRVRYNDPAVDNLFHYNVDRTSPYTYLHFINC